MTVYTARIRYRQTGTTAIVCADSMTVLELKLILLAPYADVLNYKEVDSDDHPVVH